LGKVWPSLQPRVNSCRSTMHKSIKNSFKDFPLKTYWGKKHIYFNVLIHFQVQNISGENFCLFLSDKDERKFVFHKVYTSCLPIFSFVFISLTTHVNNSYPINCLVSKLPSCLYISVLCLDIWCLVPGFLWPILDQLTATCYFYTALAYVLVFAPILFPK